MKSLPTQQDALLARARRLLHDHRTRARKDGTELDYGLTEVRQLLAEHPLCAYCKMPVGWDVSLDHRTPISQGGQHLLANLAVVCLSCQQRKGIFLEEEYRALLALGATWRPRSQSDLLARLRAGGGKRYARRRN